MKVVITGARDWSDTQLIHLLTARIQMLPPDTVILHGGCRGVDTHAGLIAKKLHYSVNVYHAKWSIHGPSAGPIRNLRMLAQNPSSVIAFHDDLSKSKGTKHMIYNANKRHIPVELWTSRGRFLNFWLNIKGGESIPFTSS